VLSGSVVLSGNLCFVRECCVLSGSVMFCQVVSVCFQVLSLCFQVVLCVVRYCFCVVR